MAQLTEWGIIILTALGWAVVGYTLLTVPVTPGSQGIFYTAGLVALAGTLAVCLERVGARRGGRSEEGAVRFLGTGMRFALAVEFALWLQSLRMLTLAYLALIVAGFAFVEFLFYEARNQMSDRAARRDRPGAKE